MRTLSGFAALSLLALLAVGCGGPTELSNADVAAQRAQFSKENFDKTAGANKTDAEKKEEDARRTEENNR